MNKCPAHEAQMEKHKLAHDAEVAGDVPANIAEEGFFIFTHSAKKFYPFKLEWNRYDIYDIAHATSQVGRYNGHMDYFYSVAQHSVYVADLVLSNCAQGDFDEIGVSEEQDVRAVLGLQALLHDATEAYMPDMPSPIKLGLPDFMALEHAVQKSIFQSFGLPVALPKIVDYTDKTIRGTELKYLFTTLEGDNVWAENIYPELEITPWQPQYARRRFIDLFAKLEAERWGVSDDS